ncbi:MAG: CBS domain-containing protein, partial [Vicinamibacterales bacterium]
WNACVVVNDRQVVLGLLRASAADRANRGQLVEDVMEPGPTTFRPHVPPDAPLKYMQRHKIDSVLVTTSDGELIGLLRRDDAEHAQDQGET